MCFRNPRAPRPQSRVLSRLRFPEQFPHVRISQAASEKTVAHLLVARNYRKTQTLRPNSFPSSLAGLRSQQLVSGFTGVLVSETTTNKDAGRQILVKISTAAPLLHLVTGAEPSASKTWNACLTSSTTGSVSAGAAVDEVVASACHSLAQSFPSRLHMDKCCDRVTAVTTRQCDNLRACGCVNSHAELALKIFEERAASCMTGCVCRRAVCCTAGEPDRALACTCSFSKTDQKCRVHARASWQDGPSPRQMPLLPVAGFGEACLRDVLRCSRSFVDR